MSTILKLKNFEEVSMKIQKSNGIAINYKDDIYTYDDLVNNIFFYADQLEINSRDKVVICMENRPEWIFYFFAIWQNSGCAVATDYLSEPDEIAYIISDSGADTVITSSASYDNILKAVKLSKRKVKVINVDESHRKETSFESDRDYIEFEEDESVSVMVYTSGTTGLPKGVMLSRKNIAANIEGITNIKVFSSNDIYGLILPFHHIYPLTGTVVMPFVIKARVVIIEKLTSEAIIGAFQKYKITILFGIPRLYTMFHRAIMDKINSSPVTKAIFKIASGIPSRKMRKIIFGSAHRRFGGNVRYFLSGGSKLDDLIMKNFGILGFNVAEGYGLSETSPLISANNTPGVFRKNSIGKPLSNVQVKIVDGEICAKGDNVMAGYHNKPEETDKVIKNGWFHTGDEGHIDKDGFLYITGRKKELIVLPNGKKVNPEEIEKKLLHLYPDMLKEVGVFSKDNGLFAIVLPDFDFFRKNNLTNTFETLRWQVIDKYNRASRDFKKILDFKVISTELPKTRIGKLKRFLFLELIKENKQEVTHIEAPDDEIYKIISSKLKELCEKDVYPDNHIELDLGIDSLGRIEFESFIDMTYGVTITADDLSEHGTVIEMYQYIKEKMTKLEESEDNSWHSILFESFNKQYKSKPFFATLFKILSFLYFRLFIILKVENRKNIPGGPVIFAPNHQSFLDGFMLIAALKLKTQRRTYFIANEKHFKSPIKRFIARNSNLLIIDINKNLKKSLQQIAQLLRERKNVIIFPEGVRTRDGKMSNFKSFFAILSKELDIPVVPVVIDGAYKIMPVDKKLPKPGKVKIEFLSPIKGSELSYKDFADSVHRIIEEKIY